MANVRRQRKTRQNLLNTRSNRPKHVNVFKRINHYQADGSPRQPISTSKYSKFGDRNPTRMKKQMMTNSKHQIKSRMMVSNTNEGFRPINRNTTGTFPGGTGGQDPVTADPCFHSSNRNAPWCAAELSYHQFVWPYGGNRSGGGGDDDGGSSSNRGGR